MAAQAGRNLLVELSGDGGTTYTAIIGQTTGSIKINREAIDITTKDDAGVRQLLADIGTFSVDLDFEGIIKDTTFAAKLFDGAPATLEQARVTVGNLFTIECDVFVGGGEISGEMADGIGYSGNLMSSGTVTYAAV